MPELYFCFSDLPLINFGNGILLILVQIKIALELVDWADLKVQPFLFLQIRNTVLKEGWGQVLTAPPL